MPSGTKGMTSTAPMRGWAPLVLLHVDQLERPADRRGRGPDDRLGAAGERDDAAVVRLVAGVVEDGHALDLADGADDLLDHLGPATLAEVRYALDQSRHAVDRTLHAPPATVAVRASRDLARSAPG